ncbi:XRE family transcriptional regulator [Motilibacter rhizosphaerae]|uniref:XRE family transcriptional regulator n=1 Tax=Motilibacter rhizosphaerae TaxID=598652 RepID=A0A4Q7NFM9_9ACTN|nr:helix-turn-helix transcriptional regulator [Motilibacter rhizosphaerae]RZS82717.1 XRE family transcriptional regulator [Motilibacter rhizosphaerae]
MDGLGARLRELRTQAGATLAEVSAQTGISVSTLSRLESGGRRATLELLLPLARAYGVTLDELVDAPPTGDPRVHLRPVRRHGATYLPLTRRPGGLQAYKQILPPRWPKSPVLKRHEGYEWLYVLSGRVRLLLGEQDLLLEAGEVAEFDTRVPHYVGNPGPETAELLNLFGPQGEQLHVRARPGS